MAIPVLLMLGGYNITPYLEEDGLKFTLNDLDGPNAGRTMTGLMIRDRVATKVTIQVTCKRLRLWDLNAILNALSDEFITVTYRDPRNPTVDTVKVMYTNGIPFTNQYYDQHTGEYYYTGLTFPLIER